MPPASGSRPYRGVAADDRRADRRARLVEAFLDLVGAEGLDGVTVRGVAERAGLTRRYFYESFSDLDALTVAAFDEVNREITAALRAAVGRGGQDAADVARAALAAGIGVVADDPRKGRLIVASTTASGPLAERRVEVLSVFTALVAAQARAHAQAPVPDEIVQMTAVLLAGGITQLVGSWLAGTLPVERDQLVDVAAGLVAGIGETAARLASASAT